MKKAKVMLLALVITAMVSSAFAFTTHKYSNKFIYTGVRGSGVCQDRTEGAEIVPFSTNKVAASTVSLASDCPDNFTQFTVN